MTGQPYPSSLAEVASWSRVNETTTDEARKRFMEFVILNCIASDGVTRENLSLKGGNALRFAYQSPRSTLDLDFTADAEGIPDNADAIRGILDKAFAFAHRRFDVKAKCQRVKRNPKNPDATRPTYDIGVGYQFPGDRYFNNFESHHKITTVIPLEVSLNDLVCGTAKWAGVQGLRVCSLEDILAEKLRSLLQQKIRNRYRWQDACDICMFTRRKGAEIDRAKIAEYLKRKSEIREIEVRKSNFDDEIRKMAAFEYDVKIKNEAPQDFIPFDEAWREVILLVQSLNIPD